MCDRSFLTREVEGRYLLKLKLKNNYNNTVTIVMMNPSKANENISDQTINKIVSFVNRMNNDGISIEQNWLYKYRKFVSSVST